jgi:hydrogenase maturation protease
MSTAATSESEVGRVLILACGNPSRGDDALGPLVVDRLRLDPDLARRGVATLADFQLQIEHVLDLRGRERVIFVDAAASGPEPFAFFPVRPSPAASFSTHALAPGALLALFRQVVAEEPPPARLLAIRGYGFELGAAPSARARDNLDRAMRFLTRLLDRACVLGGSDQSVVRVLQGRPSIR